MSGENNIHVSSHSVGGRHHSSLLAGENVACAGEMEVRRGKLVTLSNKSGHYQPEPVYLTQVIRVLSDAGVDEISYGIRGVLARPDRPSQDGEGLPGSAARSGLAERRYQFRRPGRDPNYHPAPASLASCTVSPTADPTVRATRHPGPTT